MEAIFQFADELGPVKIIHVSEPSVNLKAVLVVDNLACGLALGGVRLDPDVTTEERLQTLWCRRGNIPL